MPTLIIAGVPRSVIQRNKGYTPQVDEWSVELIGSRDKRNPDLRSCWKDVMSIAAKSENGAHIFAYHHREDEYPIFNRKMHDRHRLVWMERNTLKCFGADIYSAMIRKHITFESAWRERLRPQSIDAPSLLPEMSFSPKKYKDMWIRIRSVHLGKDDIERIYKIIRDFRATHYNKGRWEDATGLQFKVAPERHGSFPSYGNFKFTYRLPDGFHYNVQNSRPNRRFDIKSAEGNSCKFRKYTNVDCHGSIRGGI